MACLGTHFAITADVAARLHPDRPHTSAEVLAFLEELEGQREALQSGGWVRPMESAWDAIHRCLTDGKLETGDTPGHLCILGATERLWVRREDGVIEWIVNLLEPGDVRRAAAAIRGIDRAELRRRYDRIDPESFGRLCMSEDYFEYVWDYFPPLRAFFQRAAKAGRWVVFRVDQ